LQIESSRFLGTPTPATCPPEPGVTVTGIQGFDPPNFGPSQAVTNALQDFAEGFNYVTTSSGACTYDGNGNFGYLNPLPTPNDSSIRQYCHLVSSTSAPFPPEGTVLTVQLQDTAKNIGPTAQIVVKPETPTPGP
jgi:hypothetical protein